MTIRVAIAAASMVWSGAAFQRAGWFAAPGSHSATESLRLGVPVAGKPYSATVVTHSVQTFSNGTRADRTETSLVFRDAQGRTRLETDGGQAVTILDPVAGASYEFRVPDPARVGKRATKTVNRMAVKTPLSAGNAAPELGAGGAGGAVKDLGTQTVNGVAAQGTRTTTAIPAGTFGNDRDLDVVTERWVSNELQVLVKSTYADPRFGTTTYELTSISRNTPEASLFQVPAGYVVRDAGSGGGGGMQFRGGFAGTPAPTKK